MKYFYLDSDVRGVNPRDFREAQTALDCDTYKNGDVVEAWDHIFRWNSACVPFSKWKEWRVLSDDLADAALPIVVSPKGQDGGPDPLARLETTAEREHANAGREYALAAITQRCHASSLAEQASGPSRTDRVLAVYTADEFSGSEHNNNLQAALHEWPMLYGEAFLLLMVVVLLSPLLVGLAILYFIAT